MRMQEYRGIVDEITRELGVRNRKYWYDENCVVHTDKLKMDVRIAVGDRSVLCFPGGFITEHNSNAQALIPLAFEGDVEREALCPEAFFFALGNKLYRTNSTYHSLKGALAQMVSFLKTHGEDVVATILVTDMWNPNHFAEFEPELRPFANKVKIELYFFDGPGLHSIPFPEVPPQLGLIGTP